jgi:hypothetical protein
MCSRFVELVVAIVAFVTRMRDINTELTRRLADMRRRRPKSETLGRVEAQLLFATHATAGDGFLRLGARRA